MLGIPDRSRGCLFDTVADGLGAVYEDVLAGADIVVKDLAELLDER